MSLCNLHIIFIECFQMLMMGMMLMVKLTWSSWQLQLELPVEAGIAPGSTDCLLH